MARARPRRRRSPQRDNVSIAHDDFVAAGISDLRSIAHQRRFAAYARAQRQSQLRMLEVEDARRFDPTRTIRPPRKISGRAVRRITDKPSRGRKRPLLRFDDPFSVIICVRRKMRRAVLFGLRRTGKGARSRMRKRSVYTEISCKE